MQIGLKDAVTVGAGLKEGTVVDVNLTSATGKTLRFLVRFRGQESVTVDWGDGSARTTVAYSSSDTYASHTYADYGRYEVVFRNAKGIGFRPLDGYSQYIYDDAPVSIVDYSGLLEDVPSGAFKYATKLERFIAPSARWIGQRPFANCSSLKEVRLGRVYIHYDGSFQYCTELEKFETLETGTCWSYVWQGCTKLRELKLGKVTQFATQDFQNCPNLTDVWISNKTIAQVMQVAPEGNIVAGYSARFPWNAPAACRFHCTDGIVLANGTIIEQN